MARVNVNEIGEIFKDCERAFVLLVGEEEWISMPCLECTGTGEVSCCDGWMCGCGGNTVPCHVCDGEKTVMALLISNQQYEHYEKQGASHDRI